MQAQDYFARNDLEKQLETDCLKEELERESTHLLEQRIEIMLAQVKRKPSSIVQIRELIAGTDLQLRHLWSVSDGEDQILGVGC